MSSGLATPLQGLGEITAAVFDFLFPASSSLTIYTSRSGWGGMSACPCPIQAWRKWVTYTQGRSVWVTQGLWQPSATLDPDL